MTRFLLVRHAESPWTPDNTRELSGPGHSAAGALVGQLAGADIGHIYSSPYVRAVQTVQPLAIARGLLVEPAVQLRECYFGDLGVLPFEDAARLAWRDLDLHWPGGESPRAAQQRVVGFVARLAAQRPARPLLLSSHGTLLTLLLNAFDASIGYDFWKSLVHPDVIQLDYRGKRRATFARI